MVNKNVSWKTRITFYLNPKHFFQFKVKLIKVVKQNTIFKLKKLHQIKLYNKQNFLVSSKDDGLSLDLFCFNIREPFATKHFLQILNKNDVVLDIGANLGYFVVQEAIKVKKVYAVEPCKESFNLLKKNCEINNLNNIDFFNLAFGNNSNIIDFHVYSKLNLSSVNDLVDVYGKSVIEKVNMVKGKDFVRVVKNKPNVLRMDVEGFELNILKGFEKEFSLINKIFIEVHFVYLGLNKTRELLNLLIDNGFIFGLYLGDSKNGEKVLIKLINLKDLLVLDEFPPSFHLILVR